MQKIHMVDLVSQYRKIKSEIDSKILEIVESSRYIKGPEVTSFENEFAQYLGAKSVVACANGTDALQVGMMALGFKPGDEVITPTFTYVATVEVVALLGLTPVLVDVDPKTFNIDPERIEAAITSKTKAIVPVHLFGQSADMETILAIAKKHNLYVIEDNAQAIGADYKFKDGSSKKTGTIGTLGTTSFFPSKNLGCMGDGGAIMTNDPDLANKLSMVANHGQSKLYHFDLVGVNSRLDALQAGILRVKLKYLDDYRKARQTAAENYDQAFKDIDQIETPFRSSSSTHVFHQYTLKLNGIERDALRAHLESKEIPSGVYYPLPMHKHKAYVDSRYKAGDFPVAEKLCETVISLPIHTELTEDQLEYITTEVKKFIKSNS